MWPFRTTHIVLWHVSKPQQSLVAKYPGVTPSKSIPRRVLFESAGVAIGLAIANDPIPSAIPEEAIKEEDKIKKPDAKYQDKPKGQQRCEICLNFQPPSTCKIVQEPVTRHGWCQLFAAKENAHRLERPT